MVRYWIETFANGLVLRWLGTVWLWQFVATLSILHHFPLCGRELAPDACSGLLLLTLSREKIRDSLWRR